jgi:histidine kinase
MFTIGITLLLSMTAWAYLDVRQYRDILASGNIDPAGMWIEKKIYFRAFGFFLTTAAAVFFLVGWFVNRPIRKLIAGTRMIARGEYALPLEADSDDALGQLADAISRMGREIGEKQSEFNRQRDEYQTLFELVPCIITVQDKGYRLVKYNREFAEKFAPKPGDHCYWAYKGRLEKCRACPVEKTFEDGKTHHSEETGFYRDGTVAHWLVNTSPIKNKRGEIVAVIEMILDITHRKKLEEELERSEKKYYAIFDNIPNPVFVLDRDTLEVLDCNHRVADVYGYDKSDILQKPFRMLFQEGDGLRYESEIKASSVINEAKHVHKDGSILFVDLWASPSEYPGQKILLVTTSDITQRIAAEQQLAHAGKMATLGQMATGVAHELNQPLTVIKTLSSFFMKTLHAPESEKEIQLYEISKKINNNVDRAAKIINHMREFARKTEIRLEPVQVNHVMEKAVDMFSQQLKVRGIEVKWDIDKHLPMIMAAGDRLEQVFINLLVNARDAIEAGTGAGRRRNTPKRITLRTRAEKKTVVIEVSDTGPGIDDSIMGKIFEPFFTTKEVGEGTGLGLSISYGIVKDFGGNIDAVEGWESGACFRLTFPIGGKS